MNHPKGVVRARLGYSKAIGTMSTMLLDNAALGVVGNISQNAVAVLEIMVVMIS